MKNIVLLIGLCLFHIHCFGQKTENDCIKHVIATDSNFGKIRNHACEQQSLSETIEEYANNLNKIDFSNCPKSFTKAFHEHIKTWEALLPIVKKHPNLRGEMHDLFKIIEKGNDAEVFKKLVQDIWSTWAIIEQEME